MPQDESTTPAGVQAAPAQNLTDEGVDNTAEQEKNDTQQPKGAEIPDESASQTSEPADNAPDEGDSGDITPPEGQTEGDEGEPPESAKTGNAPDDAEYRDWAAKKNLPLDDPDKLGKMLFNAEKELGRKGHEIGELSKAVKTANDEAGIDEQQALRNEVAALSFKISHPEAVQLEPVMAKVLEERPWMADDLEGVLLIARGMSAPTAAEVAKAARDAGGKEALSAAERAQRAAPPRASASNRETPSPYMSDEEAGQLSTAEYQKAKAEGRIKPW